MKRLRTEYIDLLYQHRVDPEVPIEDVAGTVKQLIAEGKVKHFGLSRPAREPFVAPMPFSRSRPCRASTHCGGESRKKRSLSTLEELGIGFVPFSPLGKGFLTGMIDAATTFEGPDFRNTVPRFTPENRKSNQAVVDLVRRMAGKKKTTPAQIALAWVLAREPWIVPIPGTTRLHRLEENLGAADVELTPDDLRELDDATAGIAVQGERYSPASQRWIDR